MVKIIRKPLTDAYGRDFMTGELVKADPVEQEIEQPKRIKNWLKQKKEQAKAMGRTDGKIFVDGLGRCN